MFENLIPGRSLLLNRYGWGTNPNAHLEYGQRLHLDWIEKWDRLRAELREKGWTRRAIDRYVVPKERASIQGWNYFLNVLPDDYG